MTRAQKKNENDQIIFNALKILEKRLHYRVIQPDVGFDSPSHVKNYLTLKLAGLEHEVFAALFMNNRHKLIAYVELFRGTLNGASVYPREVVKEALAHNAAAVILVHNHPSGFVKPSSADQDITNRLQKALGLFEIRVLDHLIVGGTETLSFAESGLL